MSLLDSAPAISVLMPVWNGEKYLDEAIQSILRQEFTDFELLVIDDGSTDRTLQMLKGYAAQDPRVQVHSLEHGGIIKVLNYGLQQALAPWIARMDADDIARPNWLKRMWEEAQRYPEAVFFQSNAMNFGLNELRSSPPSERGLAELKMCSVNPFLHPSCMYSKAAVLQCGGYDRDDLHTEDFGLWGRLLQIGSHRVVPEVLLDFRVHSVSVSRSSSEVQSQHARKLMAKHAQMFFGLSQEDAERASRILRREQPCPPSDWWWVWTTIGPKLPAGSPKAHLWLALQTLRSVGRCLK